MKQAASKTSTNSASVSLVHSYSSTRRDCTAKRMRTVEMLPYLAVHYLVPILPGDKAGLTLPLQLHPDRPVMLHQSRH